MHIETEVPSTGTNYIIIIYISYVDDKLLCFIFPPLTYIKTRTNIESKGTKKKLCAKQCSIISLRNCLFANYLK